MAKHEFFNIPADKINKDTKGQILKQTVINIANALTGKKEKNQEIADAKNPFGIKKPQLEGSTFYPSDIVKSFEGITKEQLENYKKICKIDDVNLKTLKTEGVILNRLIDFEESLPIFVETHNNGSYRLDHNTQTPGPNDTRIKRFDITQTKDAQKTEIQKNAEVSFKVLFDNIACLEIKSRGRANPIQIPIKSISQEKKKPIEDKSKSTENTLLSDMEERLATSKNKKAAERAKIYIKLFASAPNAQLAEMDLMDRQGDILDLIQGNADEGMRKRYENREKKDFLDLYTILYGEKIGFN